MSDLREVRIADVARMKYGKMPPKEILAEEGYPIFSGYRVTGNAKEFLYSDQKLVVVARGVGGTGDVKLSPPQSWITNLSIVLDLDNAEVDQRYLFYKLQREPLKEKLNTGAAQAQITIDSLSSYRIRIHDLKTQERIADILAAYDDLIENNRQRIELLERAARELYREWFVRLRFPGHEHTKIVDSVPEGWEKRPLIELATIVMGQSPKSEFYNDVGDGLPFHQGVTNFGFRFVDDKIYSTAITKIAEAGDILFSVRAPVGRINVTLNRMVLGRGLAALRSRTAQQSFLLYQLKSHFFREDMVGGGAIYAAVTKRDMEKTELLTPSDKLVRDFDEQARAIDQQILCLTLENRSLTKASDLLLPRLMDGRISV